MNYELKNIMRFFPTVAITVLILMSTISAIATLAYAENIENETIESKTIENKTKKEITKEKPVLTQQQQINILQAHIVQLNKQVAILNRNQQGIAKKIGLTSAKPQSLPKVQPKITIGDSASVGNNNAKVVLVEFTDLHCPFCKKFHDQIYPDLKKQFIDTGKLRFIGKHFPIVQLHKNAAVAAFALECAREDGDYRKAKDWLFERGKNFNKSNIEDFTRAINLDKEKFAACVASPATAAKINDDMNIARAIGINQTPSFVIGLQKNGQVIDWKIITGAQSVNNFGEAIAQFTELAKTKG